MNIANLSVSQLRRAAEIKDQIDNLNAELSQILDSPAPSTDAPKKRGPRKMSATARAKIAAAQKARWAKQKGKAAKAPKKARRTMSAAGRARIAAAAKARWKKAKAQGKTSLKGL
jgi:hypothetical protein